MSSKVAPFSIRPRAMRMKCVAGSISPSHCAQAGMPRNGNMKPESRIEGSRMKKEACMAWSWFWLTVDRVKPRARLTTMKSAVLNRSSGRLPSTVMSNSSQEIVRMTQVWIEPMTK